MRRCGTLTAREMKALVVALLVVLSQASWACSADPGRETGGGSKQSSSNFEEGTLASTKTVEGEETTASSPPPEATLGAEPSSPGVVLRLEGDPKTTFSGLCTVGGEERSVLLGKVPKRYAFDLDGQKLSCRIQKQDSGKGDLKVILTAGDTTRSVQQTSTHNGFINISYQGG